MIDEAVEVGDHARAEQAPLTSFFARLQGEILSAPVTNTHNPRELIFFAWQILEVPDFRDPKSSDFASARSSLEKSDLAEKDAPIDSEGSWL